MKRTILVFICLGCMAQSLCVAQTDSLRIPQINKHVFTRNPLLDGPFTNTLLQFRMGMGQSEGYDLPTLSVDDLIVEEQGGKLLFGGISIDYQQRIKDGLAVYFKTGISGRVGTEAETIFTQGLNTINKSTLGVRVRLLNKKKSMLSTSVELRSFKFKFTNLIRYIEGLALREDNPRVTEKSSVVQTSLSAHYAYALNDLFGFNASMFYTFGDGLAIEQPLKDFNVSASVHVSFHQRFNIPLALNFGAAHVAVPDYVVARSPGATVYNAVFSYVGQKDLIFSLDMSLFENPIEFEIDEMDAGLSVNVSALSLSMSYFF